MAVPRSTDGTSNWKTTDLIEAPADQWKHRSEHMRCATCMWFVEKPLKDEMAPRDAKTVGRCRRHAPTMGGFPVVFQGDWCGDHKLDEEKV
jgi:hypothetical protein